MSVPQGGMKELFPECLDRVLASPSVRRNDSLVIELISQPPGRNIHYPSRYTLTSHKHTRTCLGYPKCLHWLVSRIGQYNSHRTRPRHVLAIIPLNLGVNGIMVLYRPSHGSIVCEPADEEG